MEYVVVVLAVWGITNVAATHLEGSEWIWSLLPYLLGVGGQALINPSYLWYGVAWGAAAVLLTRLSDLLLVTADWVRFAALRMQRGNQR